MKPLLSAVGCMLAFSIGAALLILGNRPSVRLLGALVYAILLGSILASFVYTGQIQTNHRRILVTENATTYWVNVLFYATFCVAIILVMVLAALGYIPIQRAA